VKTSGDGSRSNPVKQKPLLVESIRGRSAVTPANFIFISMTMDNGNGIFLLETSSCEKLVLLPDPMRLIQIESSVVKGDILSPATIMFIAVPWMEVLKLLRWLKIFARYAREITNSFSKCSVTPLPPWIRNCSIFLRSLKTRVSTRPLDSHLTSVW